ncbi:MAG: hypothetical protein DRN14_07665, partial [Thermoplasmata archaeon]
WGDYCGGHAVVIVGWNDADSCWICKNSWGTGWGESGWFRIKYNDSNIGYGSQESAAVAARVWSHCQIPMVFPDTGIQFFKIADTIHAYALSPVMGNSDTVFVFDSAFVDGFRHDTVFSEDSFAFVLDGPTEIFWHWDTVTGVPKSLIAFTSEYDSTAVYMEYMSLFTDTVLQWMAESAVVISADSHQVFNTSDVRQVAVSFDHWSDGGPLTHSVVMPSSGVDTYEVFFATDTVRYKISFRSNAPVQVYIDSSWRYLPYDEFMDSASSHSAYASDLENGNVFYSFDHWTPDAGGRWIYFDVDSAETLFAHYSTQYQMFFTTDFGGGQMLISDSLRHAGWMARVNSGVPIYLQVAPPQNFLGNFYIFSEWSDGIDTAHQILLDTLPPNFPVIEYTQKMSYIKVLTSYSSPNFSDSLALPESLVEIWIEDSIVYEDGIRHICSGWFRRWSRFDTLIFSSFESRFPPSEWQVDSLHSSYNPPSMWYPFCLPQHGRRFCQFGTWYSAGTEVFLTTDTFFVPADADSVRFWFWIYHTAGGEADDTLFFLISQDYGANWDTLGAFSRQEFDHLWRRAEFDLSAYAGDSVLARFMVKCGGNGNPVMIDNVLCWAAYSCADSGAGDSLAFVPEWNCTVSFRWDDQYHLAVVSPYGTPTGEGWYYPDSAAVVSVEDTVYDGGWVYVFAGWTGAVSSAQNPCTLVVSAPGTVFAVWDTLLQAAVMPTIDGAIATVDGDTAPWSGILSPDSDSVWVDFVSPCSVGADSQAVFIFWSDGATEPHWARFSSPGTLWAQFEYQFRVRAVKNPPTGAGWISLGADTATDSLYAWVFEDSAVWISASDTDFNFTVETTYVFQSFSDGVDTAHSLAVAAPMRVEALYSAEVM